MWDFKWVKDYSKYMYLGLMFPSAIAVGAGLGYLVDRFFHTHPWGKLGGFIFGVAAGFYNFYRDYQKMTADDKQKKT